MAIDKGRAGGTADAASIRLEKESRAFDDYHAALQRGADAAELRILYEALRKRVGQARRIC